MGPEVLLGIGGAKPTVDWWAVGVTLFEFLVGIPPFNDETPEKIFEHILDRDIPWPYVPEEMSEEARDLIDRLCCSDPTLRLGANGVQEIKDHPFFKDINWDTLYLEPRETTFVPRVRDPYDTGYFIARGEDSIAEMGEESPKHPMENNEQLFAGFSFVHLPSADDKDTILVRDHAIYDDSSSDDSDYLITPEENQRFKAMS